MELLKCLVNVKDEIESDFKKTNLIDPITTGTINTIKCGEVYVSNNGEFNLNCSICDEKFQKVYIFCKHILKDHKNNEISYESIDIFCNNRETGDENTTIQSTTKLTYFLNDDIKEFKTRIQDDEIPILINETCETKLYKENENSFDYSIDEDPLKQVPNTKIRNCTSKLNNYKTCNEKLKTLFECPYCNLKFKKKLNLRKHVNHKHTTELSKKIPEKNKLNCVEKPIENENNKSMEWSTAPSDNLSSIQSPNEKKIIYSSKRKNNLINTKNIKINCNLCGKETPKHKLNQHLRSHDYSRYTHKCHECGKLFISKKSLDIHVKNLHLKDKPFQCKLDNCNRSFVTEHALTAHEKLHSTERPYQCLYCLKEFLHKSKLTYHIKVYHYTDGKILNCDQCDKQFFDMYTLEKHKVCYHIDNRIKTDLKVDDIKTVDTITNENISKLMNNSNNDTEEIKNLNKKEINFQNLSNSESNFEPNFHIKNKDGLLNDRRRPGTYECIYCELKFIYKSNLGEHINRKHSDKNIKNEENLDTSESNDSIENIDDKKKKCKKSGTKFSTNKNSKINLTTRSQEKLICDICGKETVKYKMVQHLRSHDNTRYTHKCNECGKLFISDKSLQIHMKNYHLKDRPFACTFEHCNKTFATENALTAHHILHTSERPFKCSICHKGFVRKSKMEYHIKTYHVNGRIFKCDECGKRFYEIHTLQVHKICHSNEKPFACDECPARFPRERSLAWHKQSHSGVKPYICKVCGKEYALYNGIYSHMKTHGIKYSLAFERGEVNIHDFIDTASATETTTTATTIENNDQKIGI